MRVLVLCNYNKRRKDFAKINTILVDNFVFYFHSYDFCHLKPVKLFRASTGQGSGYVFICLLDQCKNG